MFLADTHTMSFDLKVVRSWNNKDNEKAGIDLVGVTD